MAHGDLTTLACDAILIPCDSDRNVNAVWEPILPLNPPRSDSDPDWLVLDGEPNDAGVIELPESDGRSVRAFVAVDVGRKASPDQVVDRTWVAIQHLAAQLSADKGRTTPLIGLPLTGTGHGGLAERRAEVIKKLLKRFRTSPSRVDVALVLFDRRDFAAVQERRKKKDWPELPDKLRAHADRLGKLAAQGELSLFLGAGVSTPVGLPAWWDLLETLSDQVPTEPPNRETDPYKAAALIVEALGSRYHEILKREFEIRQHGIGHALLASLDIRRMVTTNFDQCMEIALEAPFRDAFRVLTRQLASGEGPWLLKINGDIEEPSSIVLTEHDLLRHPEERRALEGVIQSLLLTSHLLFVGFSLTDKNFLGLAEAVSKVRARASDELCSKPGTALALTPAGIARAGYSDLHMVSMDGTTSEEGARTLEMFLDRMLWTASTQSALANEYLLDARYASGLSERDLALRKVLTKMVKNASADARSSTGWKRVAECLRSLGAEESSLK